MVTKNQIKFIKGLSLKKNRIKYKKFVVEGEKIIREFINSNYKLEKIYSLSPEKFSGYKSDLISVKELKSMSNLKSPNGDLAVFNITYYTLKNENFYIVLDGINDPGNLGTIIRTCEWFGINQIICSKNSVDCYNSKVIQASMGSLSRVHVFYDDILSFIDLKKMDVYGADINGERYDDVRIKNSGIWVFGSESHGISKNIISKIDKKVKIPKPNDNIKTESLNLPVSLGIILSKIRI